MSVLLEKFFERYDKHIIEEFAIRTISKSYDSSYGLYLIPTDTDDFDGVSPDNRHALETTLVTSNNNMEAYKYEKQFAYGKRKPHTKRIKGAQLNVFGELTQWQGGPIAEIVEKIQKTIDEKESKAKKRLSIKKYETVDLCICIDDGGWFDGKDFSLINLTLNDTIFENIFFITSSLFFRYTKANGFEQYKRII